MLQDFKIEDNSSTLYPILFRFLILVVGLLFINIPSYNLYFKLGIDAVLIVVFFVFLIKYLNKNTDTKYLIVLNSTGVIYHEKVLFHWGDLKEVEAVSKMTISNKILSQKRYLAFRLKDGKTFDIEINFVDGDVLQIKEKINEFKAFYNNTPK